MTAESTPPDHLEVEWQFDVPSFDAVTAWLSNVGHAGYMLRPAPTLFLRDTYFDTPAWHIYRAGYTCRIRRKAGSAELTFKSMAPAVDGLRSRRELNESLPQESSGLSDAAGECHTLLAAIAGGESPRPLFEVHTERRLFLVDDTHGYLAEVALDATTVQPSRGQATILRLEVEVPAPAVARARPFVEALAAANSLQPARLSKFAFALASTGIEPPPAAFDAHT